MELKTNISFCSENLSDQKKFDIFTFIDPQK